jgi:hypothetical protein
MFLRGDTLMDFMMGALFICLYLAMIGLVAGCERLMARGAPRGAPQLARTSPSSNNQQSSR